MRNKATLINMISGLILQMFTILSGFILPKIILTSFGSEVNGLVSSLNQFLSYISLVEGGITGVVMANLYKPIVEKDEQKISAVMVTANRFFKKIGILFVAYSVGLSIVYPLLFKTEFNFAYVCSLTLILSITVLVQYMFSITLKTLLDADKRVYVVNFTQTLIVICNVIFAQISVWVYPSIHILKLISGILFILQPVIFGYIVKRDYRIDWSAAPEYSLIKSRWSGFAINLAAFIHGSTDITILTILTNLKTVSVYSVYGLVSNGIKALVQACLSGLSQTVGQAYAKKDWKELNQKLDLYEYVVFVLVFFIFTVTALLINPFIQLYTRDVTDANYNQPIFGILLIISEGLYLVKFPHLNLAYAANKFKEISMELKTAQITSNKFKEITVPAYIEALLNIVISVILVHKFGLVGVAVGTIVGMTYRMMFHVYYTSKIVPGRVQSIFYKKFCLFAISVAIGFMICSLVIPLRVVTVMNWVIHAILYCAVVGGCILLTSVLFFKKELTFFAKYLKR